MPKATKEKKGRTKTNKNNLKSKKDSTKKGTKDEKFSFDEEIVIGLRRIDDEPEEKIKDNKTKRNQKTKVKKKEQKAKKQTKPQFQETEYFKSKAKERYKIEAKNSELKRRHGYDVASSSGLIGMEMQGAMAIFAVNLKRIIKLIDKK